eukprot:14021825-Heterocapsa_arctica.AAC.1
MLVKAPPVKSGTVITSLAVKPPRLLAVKPSPPTPKTAATTTTTVTEPAIYIVLTSPSYIPEAGMGTSP